MIVTAIVGVLVFTAFLIWALWRVSRSWERAERHPRYLRRLLFWFGSIYIGGAVIAIAEVVTGKEPIQILIGLPIGLAVAWTYLRLATRIKVPPK